MRLESRVQDNIIRSCRALGKRELVGIPLEEADPAFLDVRELDFDDHVAMQPSAIAYFGMMKKEAQRMFAAIQRRHDRWRKRKFSETKIVVKNESDSKRAPTIQDIEARLETDNEEEIQEQDKELGQAQERLDAVDVWYEALRQKSFSIREHASVLSDEFLSSPSIMKPNREEMGEARKMKHATRHDEDMVEDKKMDKLIDRFRVRGEEETEDSKA